VNRDCCGSLEVLEKNNPRKFHHVAQLPLTRWQCLRNRLPKALVLASWTSALLETGPAVHGSTFGWLEGNFRLLSTIGACRFVHLALEAALSAALSARAETSICHFISPPFFRIQTQRTARFCFLERLFISPCILFKLNCLFKYNAVVLWCTMIQLELTGSRRRRRIALFKREA
jgi:hypothetical protein